MQQVKLEKLLFYSVILFLPVQLGKHFWMSFSIVDGLRIDYLSPTLYLTDVLIVLLFFVWLLRLRHPGKRSASRIFSRFWTSQNDNFKKILFALLIVIVSINVSFSLSPLAGLYKLLKIFEFSFFGWYVAKNIKTKKDFLQITILLAAGIIFESMLAIVQFFQQSSIGGIFYLFGERTFNGSTPGIANAAIDGRLILRPYGTFPHPNVLAGYLVIVMAMTVFSIEYIVYSIKKYVLVSAIILGTIALLLTMSRVAILLWFLVFGYWFVTSFKKNFIIHHSSFIILGLVLVGIITFTPLSSRFASIANVDGESFMRREQLTISAVEMIKSSPVFGVGLNNFLIRLPEFQKPMGGALSMQPVHNIYLLVAAETGIIGLGFFLWFLWKTPRHLSLIIILILGFFDHYFLTLQQGQLLLALVLGFIWKVQEKPRANKILKKS